MVKMIIKMPIRRGVHPPETMMHFPPVSDSPLFLKNFETMRKIFSILPFPDKFLDFHPPKFLMTFFHKFRISPLFSLFQHISSLFHENYYFPPYFSKFPPCFRKIDLFFYILYVY